jgi:hypothetical protein
MAKIQVGDLQPSRVADKQTQQKIWSNYGHQLTRQIVCFNAQTKYLGRIKLNCTSRFFIAVEMKNFA